MIVHDFCIFYPEKYMTNCIQLACVRINTWCDLHSVNTKAAPSVCGWSQSSWRQCDKRLKSVQPLLSLFLFFSEIYPSQHNPVPFSASAASKSSTVIHDKRCKCSGLMDHQLQVCKAAFKWTFAHLWFYGSAWLRSAAVRFGRPRFYCTASVCLSPL